MDGSGEYTSLEDCEAACNVNSIEEKKNEIKLLPQPYYQRRNASTSSNTISLFI